MWPKAFAQLIELAPHISRLLPMADRFFQSKATGDEANRKAVEALGERLRADLNQVNVTHASLAEQISDLSAKLNRIGSDSETLKLSMNALDQRLAAMEKKQHRSDLLVAVVLVAVFAILILAIMIYVRGH